MALNIMYVFVYGIVQEPYISHSVYINNIHYTK